MHTTADYLFPYLSFKYLNQLVYQFVFQNRTINHSSGSHGVPGIFVKYDVFAMKICVKEEHRPYSQFLVRLCGIVGGIFVVSGMVILNYPNLLFAVIIVKKDNVLTLLNGNIDNFDNSVCDISDAIKSLKMGKSPGKDGIITA